MNTKFLLRDVLSSLRKLDQQGHYKIADKIFNNLRLAEKLKLIEEAELEKELSAYNVSPKALAAGYRSLTLKYHPDLHFNDPIAEENFKRLQNAYSKIKMKSFQDDSDEEDEDGEILSRLSIIVEEASARIKLDTYNYESMDFSPNQVIQAYKDHLLWNVYYQEGMKKDKQNLPPVRISFKEKDLPAIAYGINYAAIESYNNLKEVDVEIKYRIDNESKTKYFYKNFDRWDLQIASSSTTQMN